MTSRFVKSLLATVVLVALAALSLLFAGGASGSDSRSGDETGDVTAFNRSVRVTSAHSGNIQVLGGDVSIQAPVSGNVVVLGGNVELSRAGWVEGDLVCVAGVVRGVSRATVGGRIYAPRNGYSTVEAGELIVASMRQPFSLLTVALELSLLVVWLAAGIVLALTNPREIRSSSLEVRASPLHSFILGLVAFTSFVLTAIAFSYLIPYFIGLVLLAGLLVFAVVVKVYGMISVFHAIGTMLAAPRSHDQLGGRRRIRGDLAFVVLGFLVLGVLRLVPYLGPMIWMSASVLAVGVALSTKFGRREPWFLAWRPAEA